MNSYILKALNWIMVCLIVFVAVGVPIAANAEDSIVADGFWVTNPDGTQYACSPVLGMLGSSAIMKCVSVTKENTLVCEGAATTGYLSCKEGGL